MLTTQALPQQLPAHQAGRTALFSSARSGAVGAADPGTPSAVDAFERERGRLFAIAYRMLGSAGLAEDLLQDAYIRWHRVDHSTVRSPAAFLTRLVTRLAINARMAADRRRLQYVGLAVPETVAASPSAGPDAAGTHETTQELSRALLLLLERLTPVERAVFLLRESFDFSYAEVAAVVGKTEQNCRQIDRRARLHLAGPARSRLADAELHGRLLAGFLRATRLGDVCALVKLLAREVASPAAAGPLPCC